MKIKKMSVFLATVSVGLTALQQVSAQTSATRALWSADPNAAVGQSALDRGQPTPPPASYRYSSGPTHVRSREVVSQAYTSRVIFRNSDGREVGVVVQDRQVYTNSYSSTFSNTTTVGVVQEQGTARAGTVYGNPPGVRVIGKVVTSAFARGKGK